MSITYELELERWDDTQWVSEQNPVGVTDSFYEFADLDADTLYRWRVRSVENSEPSKWSAWEEVTTVSRISYTDCYYVEPYYVDVECGIAGNIDITLADTLAALSGAQIIEGQITVDLAATTGALVAAHGVAGQWSSMLDQTDVSLLGNHGVAGQWSSVLDATTGAITGTHGVTGQWDATLTALTASFTGEAATGVFGDLGVSLQDASAIFAGTHQSPAIGELGISLAPVTVAFLGTHKTVVDGSLSTSLADTTVTLEATHIRPVSGDIGAVLESSEVSFAVSHGTRATLAAALDNTEIALAGALIDVVEGGFSADLSPPSAHILGVHGVVGSADWRLADTVVAPSDRQPSFGVVVRGGYELRSEQIGYLIRPENFAWRTTGKEPGGVVLSR